MKTSAIRALSSVILALFCASCGPMNGKPAALTAGGACQGTAINATSSPGRNVKLSNQGDFVVSAQLLAQERDPGAQPVTSTDPLCDKQGAADPTQGCIRNAFRFRIIHASDFTPACKDAVISVQYMHEHTEPGHIQRWTPVADLQRQDDGSYVGTMIFRHAGTWDIQTQITDGRMKDEHDAQISY